MVDHLEIRDRQDAQIWNAIEANNFKQALKLVDKRLAKKRTDYLEALKIYIRAHSPLVSEKSAVLLHLEELLERSPQLSDLDSIELYDEALGEVLPDSPESWVKIIGQLRWQCVKAAPKNEDASLKCFQACLSKWDLDHARQIANSLEKSFPNNHNYIFWNITTMFLFSTSQNCPESQKKIWGGLAVGQVVKLANATKQATDLKQLPIRCIQSPQELLLLHRIVSVYGKPAQRLEYLQDSQLGPESVVAKGEWELWRLKLKLTGEARKWQELFDTTAELLKRARTKDTSGQLSEAQLSDWIVWEAYNRSAVELNGHQYTDKIAAEVEAHLDKATGVDKSWRRNASLAWVKLHFENATPYSITQNSSKEAGQMPIRVFAVVKYLQEYGAASTAYNDLREFVERLNIEERKKLLSVLRCNNIFGGSEKLDDGQVMFEEESYPNDQDLSTASQIAQVVNTYKLIYLLTCALPEIERTQSPTSQSSQAEFICSFCKKSCGLSCQACLNDLAQKTLHSYRVALDDEGRITKNLLTTDRHPADDLCILSAMCFIKLSLAGSEKASEPLKKTKTTYILQATAVLEKAWTHSKSNFQISLLLIRLYRYLGCGSLAMRAYQRLSLKQVQIDTLSYTIFDGISTFHPHPFSQDISLKNRTLVEHLQKHQKFYKSAREQVSKNIWLSFKHASYNPIFEIREVSERLSYSLSAAMSVIESRRISRLTEPGIPLTSISNGWDILPRDMENIDQQLSDNLDYETFPNFESSRGPRFEELSRLFPALSDYRVRNSLIVEKLMLIVDPSSDPGGEKVFLHQWLKNYLDFQKQEISGSKLITRSEDLARLTYYAIAHIIREACDHERWIIPDFLNILDTHNNELYERLEEQVELINDIQDFIPAFGTALHVLYTAHEVGRTALNFTRYLSKQGKSVYEKQAEACKKVAEIAQRLLQVVGDKCTISKKGLDEGGWIDKVLEIVLPDLDGSDGLGGLSRYTVVSLKELLDENFMEEWAGEVVESWKDSVVGFSYLKTPS